MDYMSLAWEILLEAERGVRSLATRATEARDDDVAMELIGVARGLRELDGSAGENAAKVVDEGAPSKDSKVSKRDGTGRREDPAYPRFERRGEELVRIAWSKSEDRPYEHRAEAPVVVGFTERVARWGTERFRMDQLIPLELDGSPVPDYKAYLVLSWLRNAGLVTKHGRSEYSMDLSGEGFQQAVQSAWQGLNQDNHNSNPTRQKHV